MYLYATTLLRMLDIKNIDKQSKEEFKETAALSFYAGRYIMLIDAERCQEEISRMALLMNMEFEIEEEILKIMNNFSKEKQEKIGQMALQIEENKKKGKNKVGYVNKVANIYQDIEHRTQIVMIAQYKKMENLLILYSLKKIA